MKNKLISLAVTFLFVGASIVIAETPPAGWGTTAAVVYSSNGTLLTKTMGVARGVTQTISYSIGTISVANADGSRTVLKMDGQQTLSEMTYDVVNGVVQTLGHGTMTVMVGGVQVRVNVDDRTRTSETSYDSIKTAVTNLINNPSSAKITALTNLVTSFSLTGASQAKTSSIVSAMATFMSARGAGDNAPLTTELNSKLTTNVSTSAGTISFDISNNQAGVITLSGYGVNGEYAATFL